MSDTIIQVENLGKKYIIGHQRESGARYTALRDVIADGTRSLLQRIQNPKSKIQNHTEEFWALKDVSFEIKRGEAVGIIGRNGAGKSTLLKILSRITEPTTGRISIQGRVASLLEVGTGFHPELTGRENIYLNGAILGMSKAEIKRKFDEIVDFAEIEKFLDTPVKRYSSGMYVRLAFAVAAHLEPEILVVDEVLAVGDAAFQKKCLGKMGEVTEKEGRTVLFVSHNMAAVNRLCRLGIWLSQGSVHLMSSSQDVVAAYLDHDAQIVGEQRWHNLRQAPGNDKIKLRAIRIVNTECNVTTTLNAETPFFVEIEYEIIHSLSGARIGFFLNNSEGIVIFAPNDSEHNSHQNNLRNPGCYTSRCQIPGELLNMGHYSITVSADIPAVESLFYVEYALQFQIERIQGAYSERPDLLPGVICPPLKWTILPMHLKTSHQEKYLFT
jgi:lipopolysaccharide transport system ATP-binding protein